VASAAPVTSAVVTLGSDASAAPGTGTTTYIEVSANRAPPGPPSRSPTRPPPWPPRPSRWFR
jgi:hypothetical protein